MSARRSALRNLVVALLMALALSLVPLVSALADSAGGFYPR